MYNFYNPNHQINHHLGNHHITLHPHSRLSTIHPIQSNPIPIRQILGLQTPKIKNPKMPQAPTPIARAIILHPTF